MAQNRCQRAELILRLNLHSMTKSVPLRHKFWRAFYDRVAFIYDAVLRAGARLRLGSEEQVRHEVIGKLEIPVGAKVLEIGCGTASNRAYLPGNILYVGVDISRRMLARAKRKCAQQGLAADLVQADATALPFVSGFADTALAMGTLQHVGDTGGALGEMNRSIKAKGAMIIIDERRSKKRIFHNSMYDNVLSGSYGEYFVMHLNKD